MKSRMFLILVAIVVIAGCSSNQEANTPKVKCSPAQQIAIDNLLASSIATPGYKITDAYFVEVAENRQNKDYWPMLVMAARVQGPTNNGEIATWAWGGSRIAALNSAAIKVAPWSQDVPPSSPWGQDIAKFRGSPEESQATQCVIATTNPA